ncbi:hypothetical protein Bbelb_416160 [Branchiostoma belcheri]|nr:hypothetical protein Bbelb_416160 [Branchiostoma belcheri]
MNCVAVLSFPVVAEKSARPLSSLAGREELATAGYNLILGYRQNKGRAEDAKTHLEATYNVRVFLVSDASGSWFQGWEAYEFFQDMYPKCFIRLVERAVTCMEDGRGYIVAVSSPGCNNSRGPNLAYTPGTAKASVEYLVRHYAKQLAPRRITCNVVIPGFTKTEAWDPVVQELGAAQVDAFIGSCGMKWWASPREVGGVAAFLCSEKAAFITGASLPMDGGVHLK